MNRYSIEPRDRVFVAGYGFSSFAGKIGKNLGKNLSGKYNRCMLAAQQNLLDHAKQSALDDLKSTSKRLIQKTAEVSVDKKNADKIVSKNFSQNTSETVTNEAGNMGLDKKYQKKYIYIYISSEKWYQITDKLKLI